MDVDDLKITVVKRDDGIYTVSYEGLNKYTQRHNIKVFNYNPFNKKNLNEDVIKHYFTQLLNTMTSRQIFGIKTGEPPLFAPKTIKGLLARILKNETRRKGGLLNIDDILNNRQNVEEIKNINKEVDIMPKSSMFKPLEAGGGQTTLIFGKSFSGKSTLLVDNLNKLKRDDYFKIIIFSESINSEPFKKLDRRLPILIYDRFVPSVVALVKNINDVTKNKYRFLIVFDDVLNVRNNIINKMFCIFRNSNISTVILTQYTKLITPASRNNCHHIYITNLKPNEFGWGSILPTLGLTTEMMKKFDTKNKILLYEKLTEYLGKNKILYYNGKNEEYKFYLK